MNYLNKKQEFISYCLSNENIYNNLLLPKLYYNLNNEAILIELRLLPHLSFIIKNAIYHLGYKWSYTIVCGLLNYDFIKNIVDKLNRNIRIIKMDKNNMTRLEYSVMLLHSSFWEQFTGNKLLIYQEDSIIFKKFNNIFFNYDYIGAPFYNKDIGNGGFSFRDKNIMIYICKRFFDKHKKSMNKIRIFLKDKDIKEYKYHMIEQRIIEDLQITNMMRQFNIGRFPSFEIAKSFSIEKYFNSDSFGGHQIWYCIKDINKFLDSKFKK